MKSFITFCYINLAVLKRSPKSWVYYIKFCIRRKRIPNVLLLKKVLVISNLTKELNNKYE